MSWLYLTTIVPPHRLETLADTNTSPSPRTTSSTNIHFDIPSEEHLTLREPRNNTFASQRKAKEDRLERHRRDGNSWYNMKQTMSNSSTSSKGSTGFRVKGAHIEPEISPPMTTMSSFTASGAGYGASQSISRVEELKLVPDEKENVKPNTRESLERQSEKRLQRMMGQSPTTPSPIEEGVSFVGPKSTGKVNVKVIQHDRPKSPTKRFFDKLGIGMPNFSRSSPEAPKLKTMSDSVPPKAAQFLGTSISEPTKPRGPTTPKKNKGAKKTPASVPSRFGNKISGRDITAPMDPAEVASHLPSKARIQLDRSLPACPPTTSGRVRSQSLNFFDDKDNESMRTGPPTPPLKDELPNLKLVIPQNQIKQPEQVGNIPPQGEATTRIESEVLVNPGNRNPTRTGGLASKAHVTAIEKVPSVYSMRAALDISGDEDGKSSLGRHSFRRSNDRWSDGEKEQAWKSQGLLPGGRLPPWTFSPAEKSYSPSVYSGKNTPRPDSTTLPQPSVFEVSKSTSGRPL